MAVYSYKHINSVALTLTLVHFHSVWLCMCLCVWHEFDSRVACQSTSSYVLSPEEQMKKNGINYQNRVEEVHATDKCMA